MVFHWHPSIKYLLWANHNKASGVARLSIALGPRDKARLKFVLICMVIRKRVGKNVNPTRIE